MNILVLLSSINMMLQLTISGHNLAERSQPNCPKLQVKYFENNVILLGYVYKA